MKLLTVGPDNIYTYDTVKEFFASFELGPKDLLVSIEVIYKQFLEPYANGANVILVDKYGAQEPTDVMIDEFIADAGKFDYDRIVQSAAVPSWTCRRSWRWPAVPPSTT